MRCQLEGPSNVAQLSKRKIDSIESLLIICDYKTEPCLLDLVLLGVEGCQRPGSTNHVKSPVSHILASYELELVMARTERPSKCVHMLHPSGQDFTSTTCQEMEEP